jgi:hypothetical protein
MGICAEELRTYVIRPVLEHLDDWSQAAENLLLGTAAQESGLGFHLKTRRGHSLGIFQIHPQTHNNLWDKYLVNNPDLASKVRGLASQHEFLSHPHAELATNLSYATAIAWMVYCRSGKPLPSADDRHGLAKFWQRHFHSRLRGSVEEFTDNYQKFVHAKENKDEIAA